MYNLSSIFFFHFLEQHITESPISAAEQVEENEMRQAEASDMDMDDVPCRTAISPSSQMVVNESLKTKRDTVGSQRSDRSNHLHDHDDEISPVKRAKEERTSPFEESTETEVSKTEASRATLELERNVNTADKSIEESGSVDEPSASPSDHQSVPSTSRSQDVCLFRELCLISK